MITPTAEELGRLAAEALNIVGHESATYDDMPEKDPYMSSREDMETLGAYMFEGLKTYMGATPTDFVFRTDDVAKTLAEAFGYPWDELSSEDEENRWSKDFWRILTNKVLRVITEKSKLVHSLDIKDPNRRRLVELIDTAKEIAITRGNDYGDGEDTFSNVHSVKLKGQKPSDYALSEMCSKLTRVINVYRKGNVTESAEGLHNDAIDLANYAMIFLVMYEEEQRLKEGE